MRVKRVDTHRVVHHLKEWKFDFRHISQVSQATIPVPEYQLIRSGDCRFELSRFDLLSESFKEGEYIAFKMIHPKSGSSAVDIGGLAEVRKVGDEGILLSTLATTWISAEWRDEVRACILANTSDGEVNVTPLIEDFPPGLAHHLIGEQDFPIRVSPFSVDLSAPFRVVFRVPHLLGRDEMVIGAGSVTQAPTFFGKSGIVRVTYLTWGDQSKEQFFVDQILRMF